MLGEVYALNTVIDEDRNLINVTFGEIIASHLASVEFVRASTEVAVGRKFKTIVTSSAGYPLDKTYYLTVKAMVVPMDILEPGGTIIVASEISEGFGSPEFRAAQERLIALGPDAFLDTLLSKSHADVDEWQTEMQLKPMRIGTIQLYAPNMPDGDRRITGVEMVDSLEDAITGAVARAGDPDVAVIPEGPYVVPFARVG
jgi:nickel-dependent lactate racemase